VDIGKVDHKILMLALASLGLNPRLQGDAVYFQNGVYSITSKRLDLRGTGIDTRTAELKRAYSGEVVKTTAKKFGWQCKQVEANKFQVVKRSF
jgi:fibronectin type 3 domain-containing protein